MIEQHDGCIIQCCKTFGSVGLRNVYPSGNVFVVCACQSSGFCAGNSAFGNGSEVAV